MSKIVPLFEELQPVESNIIQESAEDGKNLWLNGIFMQSTVRNRNGRVYPLNEIKNAVQSGNSVIKANNGIFGELDHPQTLTINSDRISHVITELKMIGNDAHGRARILPTPMGNIAKTLIESGVRIGVSSRGAGAVNEDGGVTNFVLTTIDLVVTPSAPNAQPSAIYESLMNDMHGERACTLAECVREDPKAQRYLKEEILKFLKTGIFGHH